MTTLVVTGGCGFIGSNFIRRMLAKNDDTHIVNLDALTYAGNRANLAAVEGHARYRFVHGDITDRDLVRGIFREGIEGVINFAAESHVDRSIHDARPFVHTNVLGTQVLLDAAREFRVARFVQVSTDEVYGSLGATGAFTEETPLAPNSPYAASKAAADLLVKSHAHTFGLSATITRCGNNYGPYQYPEKLIPLFISNLTRDEPVPVYGDGLQVRDWIHVEDHCAAIELVWRCGKGDDVYNIGGRSERTNLELTHYLLDLLNKPRHLIRHVADRAGHDRRYAIDCTKIEHALGWRPTIPFDLGLQATVNWYLANQEWLERIRSGDYRAYYEQQYGQRLAALVH
jgi:dTDP-glucose 4,6-dehydratase